MEDRFKAFFELLPRDMAEMSRLARKHDSFVKGRACGADIKGSVRHAVEFRHESFLTDRFTDLLRKYNIALVVADAASTYPSAEDVTADWVYVRLHGSRQMYASGYTPGEIGAWAKRIRAWHKGAEPADARRIGGAVARVKKGRDVFVFFDNTDVKLRAPVDARGMMEELGLNAGGTAEDVLAELGAKGAKGRAAQRKKA